jgi:predicted alpha/beta-fold hydrolase
MIEENLAAGMEYFSWILTDAYGWMLPKESPVAANVEETLSWDSAWRSLLRERILQIIVPTQAAADWLLAVDDWVMEHVDPAIVNGTLAVLFLWGFLWTFLCLWDWWHRDGISLRHHHSPVLIRCSVSGTGEQDSAPLQSLISRECPAFKTPFYPTPWMTNGHIQTIYAALTARRYKSLVDYERVCLKTPDGGIIAVDWARGIPKTHLDTKKPTLIVLHGLTGGSHEAYVQSLILESEARGFQCVAFNFRGCSNSEITTPQLYSASYTLDLERVVHHVQSIIGPQALLYGAGFSLGANILLKYAGETGKDCPFSGLVSIANPFDLTATNRELHATWFKRNIYSWRLAGNLIRVLKKHLHIFEKSDLYDFERVLKVCLFSKNF